MGIFYEKGKSKSEMRQLRLKHPSRYLSEEAAKLLMDKEWRLSHLYKILDKNGKLITFRPNEEQLYVLRDIVMGGVSKYIILKARQLGMTTFHLINDLDSCIFTPNYRAGIVAHQLEAMYGIFEIVKRAWQHLPDSIKKMCGDIKPTRTSIKFPHGSELTVALSFRSGTLSHLHVSELGKMAKKYPERAKEVITGSFPTAEQGIISIESTAEGVGGIFHNLWTGAPDNGFKKIFFDWTKHKEYVSEKRKISVEFLNIQRRNKLTAQQICWYYWKYKQMGREVFQEYPLSPQMAFLQSGEAIFDAAHLFLSCFPSAPESEEHYVIGADPAGGESVGPDPDRSSMDIIDWRTGNQVYHWSGIEKPDEFALRLYAMSKKYNNAIIGCERNPGGFGIVVVNKLAELGAKQHSTRTYSRKRDKYADKWGWETNSATKRLIIEELEEDLRKESIGLAYQKSIDELLSYERKENGSTGAVEGCHDDTVMSLAIANRMRREHPPKGFGSLAKKRPKKKGETFMEAMRKNTKKKQQNIRIGR